MSKTFPRKTYPPEKNVFIQQTIPSSIIDNIRTLTNAGEYGKLEEFLINYPVKLNFSENKLTTSLLHGVIRSSITNIQKLRLVELLIKYGIPINLPDEQGFTPLYYAIQLQLVDIVTLLINKTNNLNGLPKNYDYFRLALSPSIVNCKPQLINQASSNMGKYYSQQLDYERDLRILMNRQPITREIVKYILDFCKKLPEQELKYIDFNENSIKSTSNVRLLGTEYTDILPLFDNKIKSFLDTIPDKIYAVLNPKIGKINQDQLITSKIDLIKSLNTELSTFLNRTSISQTISLNPYTYNEADTPEYIYNTLIRKEFDFNQLKTNLIVKYSSEMNLIRDTSSQFRENVEKQLKELMTLESTLMADYPVFSSGAPANKGDKGEIPTLICNPLLLHPVPPPAPAPAPAPAPLPNILVDKLNQRLFYDSIPDVNPTIVEQQVQNFRGGNIQTGGASINMLNSIITAFDVDLKKKTAAAPAVLLNPTTLLNTVNTSLQGIFSAPFIGLVINPNLINIPALGAAGAGPLIAAQNLNRTRLDNIKTNLSNFKTTLDVIILNGIKINNLLSEVKINYDLLIATVREYNNNINILDTIICNIYNLIHFIQPNVLPFSGYFNNLLKFVNDIYNNINNNNIKTLNIVALLAGAPPAFPPNILGINYVGLLGGIVVALPNPIVAINPVQIIQPTNHLYYDKIIPIFNSIQTELIKLNINPDNIIESINTIRKIIYLCNTVISTISYCIGNSKLDNSINNNNEDLIQFNETINPILNDTIKSRQLLNLEKLKTKMNELQSYLGQMSDELNKNIKKFNLFTIEINNITEQYLLYNKFNPTIPIPNKQLLFNDTFVMYKPINSESSPEELYYKNNLLSLYSEQKNLTYYSADLPDNLQYRLPVPNTEIMVKSSPEYKKQINDQRKKMMGLFGKLYALSIIDMNRIRHVVYAMLGRIQLPVNYDSLNMNQKINIVINGINLQDPTDIITNAYINNNHYNTDIIMRLLTSINLNTQNVMIITNIKDAINILVKKVGTFIGEKLYSDTIANIKARIDQILPVIGHVNPIIPSIQTILSKIISGIDFKVAADTGVNTGFNFIKDQFNRVPAIQEINPIIPNSVISDIQSELYPGDALGPLPNLPGPIIPANLILFRLPDLITKSITAAITEINRQIVAPIVIGNLNQIGMISILMVIAIENIRRYSNDVNFDNILVEFDNLFNSIIGYLPNIPRYSILTTVMYIYNNQNIPNSLAAGIIANIIYCHMNPLGARNFGEILVLVSGITVVNSILNNLSHSDVILTSTIALSMSDPIEKIFDNQFDNNYNSQSKDLIKIFVPATIPIINAHPNPNDDLATILIPGGVVMAELPANIQEIIDATYLYIKLENNLLPTFYDAKQHITNINIDLLKLASAASITCIAYFNVPTSVANMQPLIPLIPGNALQNINIEDTINIVSEYLHTIITPANISVEKICLMGLAAIAGMVVADPAVPQRVHELFNNNGLNVVADSAQQISFDNAKVVFELGFTSEVSAITGTAMAILARLNIGYDHEIIKVGIIHAATLINLSLEEATTLGSIIQHIIVTNPVDILKKIAIASTLCLSLLKSGLSADAVIEGLNRIVNQTEEICIATAIYRDIVNRVLVYPGDDPMIETIRRNLGDFKNVESRKLGDFPNIYSNMLIASQDDTNDWNDSLYTLTYVPSIMKITNMNFLLLIYHEIIFKQIISTLEYDQIKVKFKQENSSISDQIINTLLLKILHSAILNNFDEILFTVLITVSNTLVNNKLNEMGILDKFDDIDNEKILNILKQKEQNKFNQLTRIDKNQYFYLDENYTSSEPIDIISCVNNNVEILKLLKKKMGFKIREYQDLIFKLGNRDILDQLNETTRDKISRIDLQSYRERNKDKFKKACDFSNKQLNDEIKQKELDFFIDDTVVVNVNVDDELMIYDIIRPIQLVMNKETPDLNINGLAPPVAPNWTYNIRFQDIYNDLIDTQIKSNIFLYEKIRIKLEYIFEYIIIPEVTEFLQFFSENELKSVITYDNLKENIRPLIGDIINYHLNIDPSKAKTEQIPLDATLSKFRDLFINLLDQNDKQSIPVIYDERLKIKIFDFMSLISKYYNNIYKNYLKFIFNDYRYLLLGANLI